MLLSPRSSGELGQQQGAGRVPRSQGSWSGRTQLCWSSFPKLLPCSSASGLSCPPTPVPLGRESLLPACYEKPSLSIDLFLLSFLV